ncbi:MAG: polyprenyl diphosphate synthase [Candidatus Hydrogenedentes bacterium]|nr:polyprenyl diphosphate synthase [Candidatus Hydrogenedentota bacterium]
MRRISTGSLDLTRLPRHIAIIMDGNGRWAERHGVSHEEGHEAGAKSVRAVIEGCREIGIETLSIYAFSTENWKRSDREVNALFLLLSKYVQLEIDNIHKEDIRVTIMGRREGLNERVLKDLDYCVDLTRNNKSMTVNVALNYGGRGEILDAAKALAADAVAGKVAPAELDEAKFAQYLYVPSLPELDLLIRTSGEMRVSNFMLWQLSYAEIVPMRVLWPDFRKRHLREAIAQYQARQRRFGGR